MGKTFGKNSSRIMNLSKEKKHKNDFNSFEKLTQSLYELKKISYIWKGVK